MFIINTHFLPEHHLSINTLISQNMMCDTVRSATKSDASGKLQILPNYVDDKKHPTELYCRSSLQPMAPALSDDIVFQQNAARQQHNLSGTAPGRDNAQSLDLPSKYPPTKFECESEVTAL